MTCCRSDRDRGLSHVSRCGEIELDVFQRRQFTSDSSERPESQMLVAVGFVRTAAVLTT